MNIIDIFFILLFFGTLAAGFFQGMIRLLVVIVALYLAVVLASLYYQPLGEFFVRNLNSERFVGQYVAFALVLFVTLVLLTIAGIYTFRYARLPGGIQYVDKIIGTVLGMLLGALLIGIFAALLWNLMIVRGGRNIDLPFMGSLGRSVIGSALVRYFADTILPLVYNFLDPVLPEGADLLFVVQ